METATLLPPHVTHSEEYKATEYVTVKKLRFDDGADDNQILAPPAYEIKLLKDLSHDWSEGWGGSVNSEYLWDEITDQYKHGVG